MTKEVYKSSTLGEIPLSFTGRHLLQNLREALQEVIRRAYERGKRGEHQSIGFDWRDVSIARGRLAQYMSQLERRSERPRAYDSNNDNELFGAFGKLVIQFEERELTGSGGDYHLHLPAIPEGYVLHIVGNIATIEPKEEQRTIDEPSQSQPCMMEQVKRFQESVGDLNEWERAAKAKQAEEVKKKIQRDKLADLLNEYRNALIAAQMPGAMRDWQERVDKARLAVFDFVDNLS